ncbi:MAG: hypothetical protein AABY93_11100 [Bacteroidota bacterium]
MPTFIHTSFVVLIFSLAIVPGFSQNANSTLKKTEEKTQTDPTKEESSRSDGLRKISTHGSPDWDFDINIDEEALEANIKLAVENAMKSVEVALDKLVINIEPIEINLGDLNLDMDPIEINIPALDIDIEPIEVNLDDLDIDIDIDDDSDWNEDEDNDEGEGNDEDEDNDDEDDDNDKFFRKDESTPPVKKDQSKEKDQLKDKSNKKEKSSIDKPDQEKLEKDKSKGLKKIN